MNERKTSSLRNFIAAASVSTIMTSMPVSAISAEEHFEQTNDVITLQSALPSISYMTENTEKLYGEYTKIVNQYLPGMSTLIITSNDLGVDFSKEEKEDIAIRSSCDGITIAPTIESVAAFQKIEIVKNNLYSVLKNLSGSETSLFKNNVLKEAVYNAPNETMLLIGSAANTAILEVAAAITFDGIFSESSNFNFAIISMPPKLQSVEMHSQGLSGLPFKYLENIERTAEDSALSDIAHEFAHVYHKHKKDDTEYYCVTVDTAISDQSNIYESEADITKAKIIADWRKQGDTLGADINAEEHALRALGALYLSSSSLLHTQHINGHVTTQMHDLIDSDFQSDIDLTQTPGASGLASTIAMIADIIAGFVAIDDIKKEYTDNENSYMTEEIEYFNALPIHDTKIIDYSENFRLVGAIKRTGELVNELRTAKDADPQYLYEAVAYIDEHRILDEAYETMNPAYAHIMKDIISDFLDSADKYASKLKNPEIEKRFEAKLDPKVISDFSTKFLIDWVPQKETPQANIGLQAPEI